MKKIMLFLTVLLVSCSSTKGFKGTADFCGILTDSHNKGVSGYTICIDGNKKCITNDSGVFIFPDIKSSEIHVSGYKKGYEKIDYSTFFYDENNFFCLTVKTKEEILTEAETAVDEKEYEKAKKLIDSIDYDDNDEKLLLLKSIIFYLNNEPRSAKRLASKIKIKDENLEQYKKILK